MARACCISWASRRSFRLQAARSTPHTCGAVMAAALSASPQMLKSRCVPAMQLTSMHVVCWHVMHVRVCDATSTAGVWLLETCTAGCMLYSSAAGCTGCPEAPVLLLSLKFDGKKALLPDTTMCATCVHHMQYGIPMMGVRRHRLRKVSDLATMCR